MKGTVNVRGYIWDTGTLAWVKEVASGPPVAGGLTNAELRAAAVPTIGSFDDGATPAGLKLLAIGGRANFNNTEPLLDLELGSLRLDPRHQLHVTGPAMDASGGVADDEAWWGQGDRFFPAGGVRRPADGFWSDGNEIGPGEYGVSEVSSAHALHVSVRTADDLLGNDSALLQPLTNAELRATPAPVAEAGRTDVTAFVEGVGKVSLPMSALYSEDPDAVPSEDTVGALRMTAERALLVSSGTGLLKVANGVTSASGLTTVVPFVSGKTLRIHYLSYNPSAPVTVSWNLGGVGTILANTLTIGGAIIAKDFGDFHYVECAFESNLQLELSAAVSTNWTAFYTEVTN
jgi:hypothetical protein